MPGGSTDLDSFDSPHDGPQASASTEGSEKVGFHDSSAPVKVPKASGVAVLERWRGFGEDEGESEGVSEVGEPGDGLSSDGGISDCSCSSLGSGSETVLSGMVSNVECAGCHVEDGSFRQSEASVRSGSSQRLVGSTDHDRVDISSSRSPWMVEMDGADQLELEGCLDGSPHAFAHGSSISDQMWLCQFFDCSLMQCLSDG